MARDDHHTTTRAGTAVTRRRDGSGARLGAAAWSRRARRLLGDGDVDDATFPSSDGLTADERRVLAAIGRGESVAVAASAMLVSPATVERHLASAMAKLGMQARDELGDLEDAPHPSSVVSLPTVVELFGVFRVSRGEVDLTPAPGMASKLVKVVALAEGLLHVDELVEVLWKDAEPGRGRARLRNVIARLRAASGDIVVRRGDLVSMGSDVEVDVVRFRREAARALALGPVHEAVAHAELALSLATDDLLLDSVYEPWSTVPRERLRSDRLALMDLLGDVAIRRGDVDRAGRLLDDAISLDPYEEHRYVTLARLLLGSGRRSAAAAVIRRARRSLAELGVSPSAALDAVEAGLRAP